MVGQVRTRRAQGKGVEIDLDCRATDFLHTVTGLQKLSLRILGVHRNHAGHIPNAVGCGRLPGGLRSSSVTYFGLLVEHSRVPADSVANVPFSPQANARGFFPIGIRNVVVSSDVDETSVVMAISGRAKGDRVSHWDVDEAF